jgi:hypothetical protein
VAGLADSMAELDTFFRSEDGLAPDQPRGRSRTVTILDTQPWMGMFLAACLRHQRRLPLTACSPITGVPISMSATGIATLSVLALEDRALSRDDSLATLRAFVSAVRAANPDPGAPALPPASGGLPPGQGIPLAPGQPVLAPVPVAQPPQTFPPEGQRLFNVGLFRRIFAP